MAFSYFNCSHRQFFDAVRELELVLQLPEGCSSETAEKELGKHIRHNGCAKGECITLDCGAKAVVTWADGDAEVAESLEATGGFECYVAEAPIAEGCPEGVTFGD
jgi:hypothetical protein